jgi:hypothetical protein
MDLLLDSSYLMSSEAQQPLPEMNIWKEVPS